MSFMNIGYSTLEDAWGENFDRKHKKSKSKPDPSCAMYAKRYREAAPPYTKRSKRREHGPAFENDEDYRKYYGYKDRGGDRKPRYAPPKRPSEELREYEVSLPAPSGYLTEDELGGAEFPPSNSPPPLSTGSPNKLTSIHEMSAGREREMSAGREREMSAGREREMSAGREREMSAGREREMSAGRERERPPYKRPPPPPVEEEYDEIDAYISGDSDVDKFDAVAEEDYYVDEEDDQYVYEEDDYYVQEEKPRRQRAFDPKRAAPPPTANLSTRTVVEERVIQPRSKEKMLLDVGIFTISGILLIFIMEQFIQIGVNLKGRTV